jgi:hypothetical protein
VIDVDLGDVLTWTYDSNAQSWLNWGSINHTLYGLPLNQHVGTYWVRINVSDGNGGYDEHNFTLTVSNTNDLPNILTPDKTSINEDEYYEVIYSANDVDLGDILTWTYESSANWLHWGQINHTLYGTPRNKDVGAYWVRIEVSDDNGSVDEHNFTLTVLNTNDRPIINTKDVIFIDEDEHYEVVYSATDVDIGDILTWTFSSNAKWLNWGSKNLTLYGIPRNDDVGEYWVRIKVSDSEGEYDEHYFKIKVKDVNDPPTITGAPNELEINSLENYVLDLEPYIDDVDNDISELILKTNSNYAKIEGMKVTFKYPNTLSSEKIAIAVSDLEDISEPHFIEIKIIQKDLESPTIEDKSPDGENVPIVTLITVTFNEPMDKTSTENSLEISPEIEGIFSWESNKLIFKPSSDFQYNTTYTITVKPIATDLAGNPIVELYSWNFTTEKQDTDSDNIPDDQDDDDDNDGYLDVWEEFLGTNPKDNNDKPLDTDSDDKPNGDQENSKPWMDLDDDNDGYSDDEEIKAGTDPLDTNDFPDYDKLPTKPEDNTGLIAAVIIIIIIVIILLVFLFIIRPRMVKRGENIVEDEKPKTDLTTSPQPQQPQPTKQPPIPQQTYQPYPPPQQHQHQPIYPPGQRPPFYL